MKKQVLFIFFTFYVAFQSSAQCAMCRAVLESGESQSPARGINDGIMFLMAVPYILVAVIGYIVYRSYSRSRKPKTN